MLKSRLLTAFILVLLLVTVSWTPVWCFNIFASAVAILIMKEMTDAIEKSGHKPARTVLYLSVLYLMFIKNFESAVDYQILAAYVISILFILFNYVIFSDNKFNYVDVALNMFAVIYVVILASFLIYTRYLDTNGFFVWLTFVSACLTDSGAYIIGMAFGKHKLPSSISPKKSIEGVFGGILFSAIGCVIYGYILKFFNVFTIPLYWYIIIGAMLSYIAQIGDLAASAIKRTAGIKDFSNLMPGHGGMLDRCDSILLVSPFVYFFFSIFLALVK